MKVQRKETVIVTMDIELNDPLQNFGDRQPETSYTILYIQISIRQTMEKTRQEKRGSPLYPGMWEYVGQIPAKLGRDEI
jgi:hypothetical protein